MKLTYKDISRLHNGFIEFICDTIEDKYRGTRFKENKSKQTKLVFPYGVYDVKITYSPKYKKEYATDIRCSLLYRC